MLLSPFAIWLDLIAKQYTLFTIHHHKQYAGIGKRKFAYGSIINTWLSNSHVWFMLVMICPSSWLRIITKQNCQQRIRFMLSFCICNRQRIAPNEEHAFRPDVRMIRRPHSSSILQVSPDQFHLFWLRYLHIFFVHMCILATLVPYFRRTVPVIGWVRLVLFGCMWLVLQLWTSCSA